MIRCQECLWMRKVVRRSETTGCTTLILTQSREVKCERQSGLAVGVNLRVPRSKRYATA